MAYDKSWDRPHAPGHEPDWQESDCYWFYDPKTGVGGYHRVGQKPNKGTGQVTLFAFARGGKRYTRSDPFTHDRSISPADRWDTGHAVDGHRVDVLDDGRMRYRWNEGECAADLEFYQGYHVPRGWSKTRHEEEFMAAMNPGGHLECSGRIRGTIRIGDESYAIDGFAHRDRSWGFRDFSFFDYRRFRMFTGTVGDALSFATFLCDTAKGRTVAGFVIRNGVEEDIKDLRVTVHLDADGLTAIGGTGYITLQSGEIVKVPYRPVQGYLTKFPANDGFLIDSISEVDYEGHNGFCDAVHSVNPARGTHMPDQSETRYLAVDCGLDDFVDYDL